MGDYFSLGSRTLMINGKKLRYISVTFFSEDCHVLIFVFFLKGANGVAASQ